jgi:hypothetical protein
MRLILKVIASSNSFLNRIEMTKASVAGSLKNSEPSFSQALDCELINKIPFFSINIQ